METCQISPIRSDRGAWDLRDIAPEAYKSKCLNCFIIGLQNKVDENQEDQPLM